MSEWLTTPMTNQSKHKIVLIEILKDIYSDPHLRTALGFKGGTAAFLFYDLPRLSVDLDFDLLQVEKKEVVFKIVKDILNKHGTIYDAVEKRFTLFFLVSYEKGERAVKVEISKRSVSSRYELKSYLGISMLVMEQGDMVASKLSALLTRKKFAMRDVFDIWFFLKNKWVINEALLLEKTGLALNEALEQAVKKISELSKNQLLQGLGDLLDLRQKDWVREKLKEETLFYLRLYRKEN